MDGPAEHGTVVESAQTTKTKLWLESDPRATTVNPSPEESAAIRVQLTRGNEFFKKQQQDYATRQEHLLVEWRCLSSTLKHVKGRTVGSRPTTNDQLVALLCPEFGHQELERRQHEAKYTLWEQAVEEFTSPRRETKAGGKQRAPQPGLKKTKPIAKSSRKLCNEKPHRRHKDYNNLLEEIEEKTRVKKTKSSFLSSKIVCQR
jgi:hypothetical protein